MTSFISLSFSLLSDSGGIQTHNLLIRSQMLYSVELRNLRSFIAGAKVRSFSESAKLFCNFFLFMLKKTGWAWIFAYFFVPSRQEREPNKQNDKKKETITHIGKRGHHRLCCRGKVDSTRRRHGGIRALGGAWRRGGPAGTPQEALVHGGRGHHNAGDSIKNVQAKTKKKIEDQHIMKDYFKPDPKRATWYAIVCPGLGQIYNRSYWKLPILYGGMLTFTYLIRWNGGMYNDYHNAYHDILDSDPTTQSYLSLVPEYDGSQTWLQSTLKSKTERYRRARDLSTFGMVALYLVSVVDAFVDAHLYDFTVTDDLTMRLEPVFNTNGFGGSMYDNQSMYVGLQCSFSFK